MTIPRRKPLPPWTASGQDAARVNILFGPLPPTRGARHVSVHMDADNVLIAVIIIEYSRVTDPTVDYSADVRIVQPTPAGELVRFTGRVEAVHVVGNILTIKCASGLQEMRERRSGGLALGKGTDALASVWSLLRLQGIDAEYIDIEGFSPSAPRPFLVSSPVDALTVRTPQTLGGVNFVGRPPDTTLGVRTGVPSLEAFHNATIWAVAQVTAKTLYDADLQGLRLMEVAVGVATVLANFAQATAPGGNASDYSRLEASARPSLKPIVLVKAEDGGDEWLRVRDDIPFRPSLSLDPLLRGAALGTSQIPRSLQEALLAWRRAVATESPAECVTAIWEAIEFMVGDTTVPRLFTKAEVQRLTTTWAEGLEGRQAERARDLARQVNNAPLVVRLIRSLGNYGIPYEDAEIELLREIRTFRNSLVHGRASKTPPSRTLRYALSFVARMLVYRIRACDR